MHIAHDVPLARRTTLGVGGSAEYLVSADSDETVARAVEFAKGRGCELRVLGGGSNIVVSDRGVPGLVLEMAQKGLHIDDSAGTTEVTVAAGEVWDDVVERIVAENLRGIECLSGIPGLTGATPIQNVGAYGQEVADTVDRVRVYDTIDEAFRTLSGRDCEFGYRSSRFKRRDVGRYIVLEVTFVLEREGSPLARYAELARDLADRGIVEPSVEDVRRSVLELRRAKSMVFDPGDPNRRSCGSFFINPVVDPDAFRIVRERAGSSQIPHYPQLDGREKLSAAWLIEQSGLHKGYRHGSVGLSTGHALAIVCHEGATAQGVRDFAALISERVKARFEVTLEIEPNLWGDFRG